MSWSLSLSGHCTTPDQERALVEKLNEHLPEILELNDGGAPYATWSGSLGPLGFDSDTRTINLPVAPDGSDGT